MIVIFDGNHMMHQYFAVGLKLAEEKGEELDPMDVLNRFLHRIEKVRERLLHLDPTCVCVFDNDKDTFRHWLFPAYKAGRGERDPRLTEALDAAKHMLPKCSDWIALIASYGYEADDVMASIAHQATCKVLIHSVDKDLHQCLEQGRVTICKSSSIGEDHRPEMKYLTADGLREQFGFGVERWVDYQCLIGDTADAVIGCKGIGPKTAVHLILKRESLEEVVPYLDLNKAQAEEWPKFLLRLPVLRQILEMKTELDLPKELQANE